MPASSQVSPTPPLPPSLPSPPPPSQYRRLRRCPSFPTPWAALGSHGEVCSVLCIATPLRPQLGRPPPVCPCHCAFRHHPAFHSPPIIVHPLRPPFHCASALVRTIVSPLPSRPPQQKPSASGHDCPQTCRMAQGAAHIRGFLDRRRCGLRFRGWVRLSSRCRQTSSRWPT